MKGVAKSVYAILLLLLTMGCVGAGTEIKNRSESLRTDVFSEAREDAPPEKSFADLTVIASVKTHVEGRYHFETPGSLHGAKYPSILNIDGQAVTWMVPGVLDRTPHSIKEGEHAEGGEGMRYNLLRRIRLRPGTHTVFFALPGDGVSTEITIDLLEGSHSVLKFVPVYRRDSYHGPRFDKGVDRLETYLNGRIIKE